MEHARRDRPPVVGRRTHVVDRAELAGQAVGRTVSGRLVGFSQSGAPVRTFTFGTVVQAGSFVEAAGSIAVVGGGSLGSNLMSWPRIAAVS